MRFGHQYAPDVAQYSNEEMRLYDSLGPLARSAIGRSPRIIDVAKVVREVKTNRPMSDLDGEGFMRSLEGDILDQRVAEFIERLIKQTTGKSMDEFVIEARNRRKIA